MNSVKRSKNGQSHPSLIQREHLGRDFKADQTSVRSRNRLVQVNQEMAREPLTASCRLRSFSESESRTPLSATLCRLPSQSCQGWARAQNALTSLTNSTCAKTDQHSSMGTFMLCSREAKTHASHHRR